MFSIIMTNCIGNRGYHNILTPLSLKVYERKISICFVFISLHRNISKYSTTFHIHLTPYSLTIYINIVTPYTLHLVK